MAVFTATLSQTAFLFLFIVAGYILAKGKFVPDNAHITLSKLESTLLIPALMLGIFMEKFTAQTITQVWKLLLGNLALTLIFIGLSIVCGRLCSKDKYTRNIYTYGLSFSNFGYVGNAVVSALFPEIFLEYSIFTLPIWTMIYLWGIPVLLMDDGTAKQTLSQRAKRFINPMLICTLLGMLLGLLNAPIPAFIRTAVTTAGNCMSPVAMLLTGITIAHYDLLKILKIKSVYIVTFLRLIIFPLLFLAVMRLIPMSQTFAVCAVTALSMPLGLSTIIIPSGMGKDTRVAAGMALVSHILGCITIPIIFMLFNYLVK